MRSLRTSLIVGVVALGVFAGSANGAPVAQSALDVASCGVDEFDGTALDTTRWNVLRPNAAGLSVAGGQLRLQALTGDLFGDRDTAQNVVLQTAPTGAWTATAQFDTSALTVEGQQTGIVVRKGPTTFSKFVFINKGVSGTRFEHIFTRNQQARLESADFTPTLPAGFPAVVKVRVISDGTTIRGEYASGSTWLPIGRPASIGSGVQVGVYAADNAADGPVVPYDSFSLNAQSDEFAGTTLETCRWSQIVREAAHGLPGRQRRARTRHGRRRDRRHGTQPDRPARPGHHLGGRDQARPHDDVAGPAGRPVALQGADELDQGRARPHGRHHGTDRVRPRQGRRLPARRSVQCRRRHHAYIPLPADAGQRRHGDRAVLHQWDDLDGGRQGARHLRSRLRPPRPSGAARHRCHGGHGEVRLRARSPRRACSRRWASQAAPSASSARSTAIRRTRCRRRRCRPRAP